MKGILLAQALFSLLAISCKKEYTCDCTTQQSFGTYSQNVSSTSTTPKMTKQEAREYCNTNVGNSAGGVSQSVECKLRE